MKPYLKVCCISSPAEMQLAVSLGANAIGLVGEMPSGPGVITDELAREIAAATPPPVMPVLLSSRVTAEDLADHVKLTGVPALQIVNHIEPGQYERLRSLLPTTKLIQVLHVENESSMSLARVYENLADALLLDSGKPSEDVPLLGGTGKAHDWKISARIVADVSVPVFLAGGLKSGNVRRAVETVRPHGLDVCSGIRTGGRLDADKLALFAGEIHLASHTD